MADAVTSALIENGPRNWVYVFTNLSDGTGESNVVKVDGSAGGPLGVVIRGQTFYPLSNIKIREIEYDVKGMALQIIWDAASPQNAFVLGGFGRLKFDNVGGIAAVGSNGAVLSGATGKIKFTTLGQMVNSGYTVTMRGTKGIPQS
jgi:hypothetical protein